MFFLYVKLSRLTFAAATMEVSTIRWEIAQWKFAFSHAVLQLLRLRPIFLQLERRAIDVSILPSESFGTAGNFSLGNVHQWKSKGESVEENNWYADVPQAGNDDRLRKHLEESIGEEQGEKSHRACQFILQLHGLLLGEVVGDGCLGDHRERDNKRR